MQVDSPERIRNVALVGHNDTGKTTLANALLYTAGAVNRFGRVEDGNTITDFDAEEIERGISIGLSTCFVPWKGHKVNLIDCPGYGIFFTEAKAGMRAADVAVLCVNGVSGIEVTTEKSWEFAAEIALPVMIHLNKMDRERAELERNFETLQKRFGREVVPVQIPVGKEHGFEGVVDLLTRKAYLFERDGNGAAKEVEVPAALEETVSAWGERLVEAVAETDDALMERFFDHGTLEREELIDGLRKAVLTRGIFPLTMSSAAHNIGTATLLDAITGILPSPADRRSFPAQTVGGEPVEVAPDPEGPLSALIFKTLSDPFTGKISLLRVVSGTLRTDATLWNSRQEEAEKLANILVMQGKQGSSVPEAPAGDIVGAPKLKGSHTGETLCEKGRPVRLAWIDIPEAAISFAIEPKSKGDEEKIGDALARLMEEDPTLSARREAETGEFLLAGTGQLHVEIAVAKLKKRFNVEVILHPPKVPYRETIRKPADGHGRHKKQTGGRGQFADCKIKIEPLARGTDFEFVDEIFGGSIPQQFRPAVEKGIQEARRRGFLAGFPVVDFRVRLLEGQHHDVDSSEMAFKIAGSLAFKDAMAKARPTLLEPIMQVEITTTEEFMGDIMSDLSQRRGRPQGMESRNGMQVVKATVPMAEMLNYAPALRSMTQGRASFHMEFAYYEEVPKPIQEKLIAESQRERQQEAG